MELLTNIIGRLDAKDLLNLRRVCKRFNDVVTDEYTTSRLWRKENLNLSLKGKIRNAIKDSLEIKLMNELSPKYTFMEFFIIKNIEERYENVREVHMQVLRTYYGYTRCFEDVKVGDFTRVDQRFYVLSYKEIYDLKTELRLSKAIMNWKKGLEQRGIYEMHRQLLEIEMFGYNVNRV